MHMTWDEASTQPAIGLTVVSDPAFDDRTGRVQISGDDHSDPSTLPAGGTAQFDLVSHTHPYASYKVQAAPQGLAGLSANLAISFPCVSWHVRRCILTPIGIRRTATER